jgi:hypothetical protein
VSRKWWSSGSTRRYLNIELDQKRSMRSCRPSVCSLSLHPSSPYPVVYLAVSNWVVDAIARASCCGQSFIANEEVQVFGTTFSRKMSTRPSPTSQIRGFVCDSWASRARSAGTASWAFGSYRGGKDEGWGVVAGETWGRTLLRAEEAGIDV